MEILRATETWQQAGAYYVRIQAMAKKHHITLRQEFDEHDGEGTKYIVITDEDFPVATARMYELDGDSVMIGRVVVLPEYRHQGLGSRAVTECERWAGKRATPDAWWRAGTTRWSSMRSWAMPLPERTSSTGTPSGASA